MTSRRYATPAAFKQALEERLRARTATGVEFTRRRQLLVFDRFLARVAAVLGDAATLKGGVALELRLERARTTRDVDLRVTGSPARVLGRLQAAGRQDLGDFLAFEIGPDPHQPQIQSEGMQYGGLRFRAECRLAGRPFGQPFGVDVAFGDPMLGTPDEQVAEDLLDFAGVPPPRLRLYPIETHIAEKLHAYTLPRARPNSRVKDLPDLALLATIRRLESRRLRAALARTFRFRKTHPVPGALPEPPATWAAAYAALAREDRLPWRDLAALATAARAFLDPVLARYTDARWDPKRWAWRGEQREP
jgi:hypothetical protein